MGEHQKKKLHRKQKTVPESANTIDSFYVLYVLSTGIIDDVKEVIKFVTEGEWHKFPLQLHIISVAPNHLA